MGLQGITDLCARLEQEQNGVLLRKALTHLPAQPLYAVLGALEHVTLPEKLAKRLSELAEAEVKASDPDLVFARGSSESLGRSACQYP